MCDQQICDRGVAADDMGLIAAERTILGAPLARVLDTFFTGQGRGYYCDTVGVMLRLMLQREPTRRPSINGILSNPFAAPHFPDISVAMATTADRRGRRRSNATPTPMGTEAPVGTPATSTRTAANVTAATVSGRTRTPTAVHDGTTIADTVTPEQKGVDQTHGTPAAVAMGREAELQAREAAVTLREQRVAEKEKELERREQEVLRKERYQSASRRRSESAVSQNPRLFRPMQPSNVSNIGTAGPFAVKYGSKV
eukprot:m.238747 g.238747  ORF g.238747 m.238747 type:complete len:255 (+) comp19395_c0_seq3:3-767(+)